jgi:5'-nucleotidase
VHAAALVLKTLYFHQKISKNKGILIGRRTAKPVSDQKGRYILKLVLTNDDGYLAPGLTALIEVAGRIGQVMVVAPIHPQSGVGHQVSMKTPLRVESAAKADHFMVHGAPADCTRLALKEIVPDADWILSGINQGANLGSDVYQSGTVAAAREAAILGKKSIAVSQYIAREWLVDWDAAVRHLFAVLPIVMNAPLAPGCFWNINLPSPITIDSPVIWRYCPLDKHPHKYRYRKDGDLYYYEGVIHDRPRTAGSDVDICFSGNVSITCVEI